MSPITTHVLDIARGRPAEGIVVYLQRRDPAGAWTELARGVTNANGRIADLLSDDFALEAGVYRLRFATGDYFRVHGSATFYPEVQVIVQIMDPGQNYHIPLLLSPYGYSTYRGS